MDKEESIFNLEEFFATWDSPSSPCFSDSFLHKYYDPTDYDLNQNLIYEHLYTEIVPTEEEINEKRLEIEKKLVRTIFSLVLILLAIIGVIVITIFIISYYRELATQPNQLNITSTKNFTSVSTETPESITRYRRDFIKGMFLEAWNAYKTFAWGGEMLKLDTNSPAFSFVPEGAGAQIVAAMSTLWAMDLKEEFAYGKEWIEKNLKFSQINYDTVAQSVISVYVGGLLSCYALTQDQMFLNKAVEVAQAIDPVFNSSTGLPFEKVNPKTGAVHNNNTQISSIGSFQTEYYILSDLTGDPHYRNRISRIRSNLRSSVNEQPDFLNVGELAADSNRFLLSLVSSFIQSARKDLSGIEMYKLAIDTLDTVTLFHRRQSKQIYVIKSNGITCMQDTSCMAGALLGLGVDSMEKALPDLLPLNSSTTEHKERKRIASHRQLAEELTMTCHLVSSFTKTGLLPAKFCFNLNVINSDHIITDLHYFSNHFDLAMSYFIQWRLNHKQMYRELAWQMTQTLHLHTRWNNGGYSNILNVNAVSTKEEFQHWETLAATFKYLYLTFAHDSVLPLEKWVFNAAGQPLPVCGKHGWYPEEKCNRSTN